MAAEERDGETGSEDETRSFFADRFTEQHDPWTLPPTAVEFEDADGPYDVCIAVEIDPPDDRQVAALDDCRSALDELDVLAGEQFDDLLDVLDALDRSPAAAADELLAHFHLDTPPEDGWLSLVERLNVYGEALEYDVWERGGDLAVWFRGERRWDELLRIAARLPIGSHYRAAVLDDDELEEVIAAQHGPASKRKKGSSRPALQGFTTEVSYLHRIENAVRFLGWAIFAAQAGKKRGSPPKPAKGPETAADRFERLDERREHTEVVAQVLKRKGGSKPRERTPAPEAVRGAVLLGQQDT